MERKHLVGTVALGGRSNSWQNYGQARREQGDKHPNPSLFVPSQLVPCFPLAKPNWKQEGSVDWMIQFSKISLLEQDKPEKDLEG